MPGITRRAEVMAELGTPQALARHEDGVAMFYEHVRLTEQQFGVSLGKAFSWVDIDAGALFKAITSSSGALHEAALLLFDGRGVLLACGTASWPEVVGRGGGCSFLLRSGRWSTPAPTSRRRWAWTGAWTGWSRCPSCRICAIAPASSCVERR